MKCLIDADLLLWECSYAGQVKDEETGEIKMLDFSNVQEVFDQRVKEIEDACWADEPSTLYFTADEKLVRQLNKQRKRDGREAMEFRPNYRFERATSKPYKARKSQRPLHYYNLRAYALATHGCRIAVGMEADDLLAMEQQADLSTIICSRDKDLRQVAGMQYSWECGAQPGWGPKCVSHIGELSLSEKGKLSGEGMKFFYAQLIMGDPVDTIPGLPRGGPAMAYKALAECESEEEMYAAVKELYEKKMGDSWREYLQEQADLLWMVREVENDEPVMYKFPESEEV